MLLYLKYVLRLSCCNHRKHHGHLGVKSDAFRSANYKKKHHLHKGKWCYYKISP